MYCPVPIRCSRTVIQTSARSSVFLARLETLAVSWLLKQPARKKRLVGVAARGRWKRGIMLHCMNAPQPEGHMASHIGRRKFLATLFGCAAAAWPLAAWAQPVSKLPTIGFLGSATSATQGQWVAAFVQHLRELGWIEGRTVAIEFRWAEGRTERYAEIAAE